jgi:hypothetical protein
MILAIPESVLFLLLESLKLIWVSLVSTALMIPQEAVILSWMTIQHPKGTRILPLAVAKAKSLPSSKVASVWVWVLFSNVMPRHQAVGPAVGQSFGSSSPVHIMVSPYKPTMIWTIDTRQVCLHARGWVISDTCHDLARLIHTWASGLITSTSLYPLLLLLELLRFPG